MQELMGEGRGRGGAESERRQEIGGHRLQWNVHWWRVSFFVFIPHRVSCVGPLIRSDKPGLWKSGRFTPTANRRTTGSHPQHWDHTHARGPRCVCVCVCGHRWTLLKTPSLQVTAAETSLTPTPSSCSPPNI